jgi:hypothetical protein
MKKLGQTRTDQNLGSARIWPVLNGNKLRVQTDGRCPSQRRRQQKACLRPSRLAFHRQWDLPGTIRRASVSMAETRSTCDSTRHNERWNPRRYWLSLATSKYR